MYGPGPVCRRTGWRPNQFSFERGTSGVFFTLSPTLRPRFNTRLPQTRRGQHSDGCTQDRRPAQLFRLPLLRGYVGRPPI